MRRRRWEENELRDLTCGESDFGASTQAETRREGFSARMKVKKIGKFSKRTSNINGSVKRKACLRCRSLDHQVEACPQGGKRRGRTCYNCGKSGHSLRDCTESREGGLKFADCFICGEKGHISRDCPKNENGIYVKGGCCKICGSKQHLARDCDGNCNEKNKKNGYRGYEKLGTKPQNKKIIFGSGDDIGDDFTVEEGVGEENLQDDIPGKEKGTAKSRVVVF
mmetsp:Transcript_6387/g.39832  ORF Transcript_6387/g.39832 Transcript_6387/m.39832 type:complete len:223 (-) Transcript_6387:959-1627(-)